MITRVYTARVLLFCFSLKTDILITGQIGINLSSLATFKLNSPKDDRFYMNTGYPALSAGNISRLHYCYFPCKCDEDMQQSTVAFYRQSKDSGPQSYMNTSQQLVLTQGNQIQTFSYGKAYDNLVLHCSNIPVEPSVQIQEGDVIGACIRDFGNILKLDIIAKIEDNGGQIMGIKRSGDNDYKRLCKNSGCVPVEVHSRMLQSQDDTVLLVFASTTDGDDVFPTDPILKTTPFLPTPTVLTVNNTELIDTTLPSSPATTSALTRLTTVHAVGISLSVLFIVVVVIIAHIILLIFVIRMCRRKKKPLSIHQIPTGLSQSLLQPVTASAKNSSTRVRPSHDYVNPVNYINQRESNGNNLYEEILNSSYQNPASSSQRLTSSILANYSVNNSYVHISAVEMNDYEVEMGQTRQSKPGASPVLWNQGSSNSYDDIINTVDHAILENYDMLNGGDGEPMGYEFAQSMNETYDYANYSALLATMLELNQKRDIFEDVSPYQSPASEEHELYYQLKGVGIRNIHRQNLQCLGHLGSGQFGTVEEAIWNNGLKNIQVALKSLNGEVINQTDKVKFLQEAFLMAQFKHPNIIQLYGVVSIGQPIILVTELASKGDLFRVLHSLNPVPGELPASDLQTILLSFSQQIALGMQYLSSKSFIHRDLAARNVLVAKDNVCKIADFGMSRALEDTSDFYISAGGLIPVKWTAPEAIRFKRFSTASDVWSYGCVLYEIWSLGHKPFENKSNTDVIKTVTVGVRLHSPPGCPKKIYKLMLLCWRMKPCDRPSFRTIVNSFNKENILDIPQRDLNSHPMAGVLGSSLTAGRHMYRDLRTRYSKT